MMLDMITQISRIIDILSEVQERLRDVSFSNGYCHVLTKRYRELQAIPARYQMSNSNLTKLRRRKLPSGMKRLRLSDPIEAEQSEAFRAGYEAAERTDLCIRLT
jgi:hypothetical protein